MASTQSNGKYLKTSSLGFRTSKPAAEPSLNCGSDVLGTCWRQACSNCSLKSASTERQNGLLKLELQWLNLKGLFFLEGQQHRTYFYASEANECWWMHCQCGHSLTTPEARIARIDEEGLDLKPSKAKTAKNKEAGPLASWIYGLLASRGTFLPGSRAA